MTRGRRLSRPNRRDRESGATAIEFVLWTPLLFLLMFGSVQFGLAMFARHVAVTAAQEGARAGREQAYPDSLTPHPDAWKTNARDTAKKWVTDLIGGLVADPGWEPVADGGPTGQNPTVTVTVQFSIVSAVPGWRFTVSGVSQGPVECFYGTGNQEGECEPPNGN